MIAGLETITAGEISIDGNIINRIAPKDRDIAMVFQNYALYPHMNVRDNLAYGLKIRGGAPSVIETTVRNTAKILGIESYLGRRPRQLSGGQRQRVAMGRSIVREPVAFLFDEPLSNLDAKLRGQMRHEIRQLQRDLGTTALYVTHDQVEAMTLADRVVVLNKGKVEQIAAPMDLYKRPGSIFVADFVGTNPMNLMDATMNEKGQPETRSQIWPVPENLPDKERVQGRHVVLGVRPEHVQVERGGSLLVEYVEPLGSDTIFGARGSDEERLMVRSVPEFNISEGESIAATADPALLHVFDAETGRRLN
jgi:ABC-type sugar transport system ATPase subunit